MKWDAGKLILSNVLDRVDVDSKCFIKQWRGWMRVVRGSGGDDGRKVVAKGGKVWLNE